MATIVYSRDNPDLKYKSVARRPRHTVVDSSSSTNQTRPKRILQAAHSYAAFVGRRLLEPQRAALGRSPPPQNQKLSSCAAPRDATAQLAGHPPHDRHKYTQQEHTTEHRILEYRTPTMKHAEARFLISRDIRASSARCLELSGMTSRLLPVIGYSEEGGLYSRGSCHALRRSCGRTTAISQGHVVGGCWSWLHLGGFVAAESFLAPAHQIRAHKVRLIAEAKE